MISIPALEQRSKELFKEIKQIETEGKLFFSSGSKEKLVVRKTGETYKYYSTTRDEAGKRHEHFLNKYEMNRAKELALHNFDSIRLREAIEEKRRVDGLLEYLKCESESVQFLQKNPGQAEVINDVLKLRGYGALRREDKEIFDAIETWKKQEYRKNINHPENLKADTVIPGFKVRSKSESMIVSLFEKRHVAYHYEEAFDGIDQNGHQQIIYSDFRCKNFRTNAIVIIEHLGLVDNENYMRGFYWRNEIYRRAGFYLGKNLLVTTETNESLVDLDYVNYIVDHWLI